MAADCQAPSYLPASWKGIPFNVDSSDDKFGRRGDLYEYPLSEETAWKDLGRKARRFKLEGYLIGGNQVALTNAMALAAESPEPGILVHPMFGPQLVACRDLDAKADYEKDVRRTKLTFDFIEANVSLAPYMIGAAIGGLFDIGQRSIGAAIAQATWTPSIEDRQEAARVSRSLAQAIAPGQDEESWDAIDKLSRPAASFQTFVSDVAEPIVEGTATIRRIHADAVSRLERWNSSITAAGPDLSPSAESLVLVTRLALASDLALSVSQERYTTVGDALADLDFVMNLYDEEEAIAAHRCADELTVAIRTARAAAVRTILGANIRLPGVSSIDVQGVWPSLVAARKKYGDGKRYLDVENYNPQMNPYFVGKDIVAPAA